MKSILTQKLKVDKNQHYGYLLEVIKKELEDRYNSWPIYVGFENEKEALKDLIEQIKNLLDLLQQEDSKSRIRSKEYLIKQKAFFLHLNKVLPTLYY